MEIYQIHPIQVVINQQPWSRDIQHQADRLRNEGQIEPLVAIPLETDSTGKPVEGCDWVFNQAHHLYWAYSPALVMAAKRLNWDTILVTY